MGSSRLPGKVLMDLGGQPMLALMLGRLGRLPVDALVVATSTAAHDDPIVSLCAGLGVATVRGPERDVLRRFRAVLDAYPADTVIRLTADCPLMDPALVADVVATHGERHADYTSNTLLRTYPDGLDVEVVRADLLLRADDVARDPVEREHVTPWVYRHPEWHDLVSHRGDRDAGDERWTVDTALDIAQLDGLVAGLADPATATWEEMLDVFGRHADRSGFVRLRPAAPDDEDFLLELRNDADAVRFSATGRRVRADEHHEWFAQRVDRPGTRLFVAVAAGGRVGQARVDVTGGVGEVSFAVAPAWRGRGYGAAIITTLLDVLRQDHQCAALEARVHPDNAASLRCFERAGFHRAESSDLARFVWARDAAPPLPSGEVLR